MGLKKVSFSKYAIAFVLLFSIWFQYYAKRWNENRIIEWDVKSYYFYLPAIFIYNDISLEFTKADKDRFSQWFWVYFNDEGKHVGKMTMGMSVLYSPFFAVAHLLAEPLGYEPTGYSIPYRFAISIGALFYLMLGLILLRKLLLRHFSDTTAAITLILVTLGTNLTWYATIEPGMSHVYSFTLFVVFIYLLQKWLERVTIANTILLGLLSGLISLVRPTNAAIGVLFLLWGISNRMELKERLKLLYARWPYIYTMIAAAICIWIPQMLYWKMQTGHFLYHSYGQEGFFFFSPKITDGLFSFRKGWLLYTPTMAIALIGLLILPKYSKGQALPIFTFTLINIYIIFSWWCWWYGGSFGARAFIESYALLAFPLAALVQWSITKNIYIKIASMLLFALLLFHSIFQTFQYYYGAIHWDSMTRGAYINSFLSVKPQAAFYGLIERPDYASALQGKPEVKSIAQLIPEENDIYFSETSITIEEETEFREIFKRQFSCLPENNMVKVMITPGNEKPLPKDLLFSVLISNTKEESLYYMDFMLSSFIVNETPIKWGKRINIDTDVNTDIFEVKIFFWSPKKEHFSIKEVKVLLCNMKPCLLKF